MKSYFYELFHFLWQLRLGLREETPGITAVFVYFAKENGIVNKNMT